MTADELKERRMFLNMTQTELANRFGLSIRTIQYYEAGEYRIPQHFTLAMDALELEQK